MTATVLDAGVLIGFLAKSDVHHAAARDALIELATRDEDLVVSAVTLAEVFVGQRRAGELALREAKARIYQLPRMRIVPFDHVLAEATATVRATAKPNANSNANSKAKRLRLPDAAVVATARAVGADRILTTDKDFRRVEGAVSLRQFNSVG